MINYWAYLVFSESERDEESLKREKELLARLVEVVNEKSTLVEGQADEEYRQSLEERNIGDLEKKIKKGEKLQYNYIIVGTSSYFFQV